MRKPANRVSALCAMATASLCLAAAAQADDPVAKDGFGIAAFDGLVTAAPIPDKDPSLFVYQPPEPTNLADPANFPPAYTQAGGHPYEAFVVFRFNRYTHPMYGTNWPEEPVRTMAVDSPPGLIGNPVGIPECKLEELALKVCPVGSQVGTADIGSNVFSPLIAEGIYRMATPTGMPARFGMNLYDTIVNIDAKLRSDGDYGISLISTGTPEGIAVNEVKISFWGVPADPRHDRYRHCPDAYGLLIAGHYCSSDQPERALLTLPTSCPAPGEGLTSVLRTDSWFHPGDFKRASFVSHQPPGWLGNVDPFTDALPFKVKPTVEPHQWGAPQGPSGCEELLFEPQAGVVPSTNAAESTSGLSVEIAMPDEGFSNPQFLAQSVIEKAVITLPEGVTINPAAAEGLGSCAPAQLEAETPTAAIGEGCPAESRIGSVAIETPLLDHPIDGSLFIAQQDDPRTAEPGAENPFDSDLAMYIVAKDPQTGVIVKLAGEVRPDEKTGQLVSTFDDLPQLPFSKFRLRFREGQRGILVSPPACGTYETKAEFTPYSDPSQVKVSTSSFQVTRGVGGGACPTGGVPPLRPGFSAGSLNNNAASYSPFLMRLTRQDGDQDMTRFSADLPPGVVAKLAGTSKCPQAAVEAAKARTWTGKDELTRPSCPAGSQIGRVLVGVGVGEGLTYVAGKMYLGGPFGGAPLSAVVITPGVAGPFDVGTIVTQEALTLDPLTAEVHVDGRASDPIPHILKGIPVKVRDIRVYVDRPEFILNPTSCEPFQVKATLFGAYLDVFDPADDAPTSLATRYQAANCANLGFKPRLSLKLNGGSKRGAHPSLRAVLRARPGDANIGAATVTLPKSAFLDQGHIRTICTRVQFAANQCPKRAQYGYARAFTPLLDEPLEGPVYLRSSNHKLPDLVAALDGLVDVDIVGRIDSFKGGLRSSFESVPDAPVSKFVLTMQGGKKGLVINSRDLCAGKNRAKATFTGQNGKRRQFRPVVGAQCGKGKRRR